jgi:L-arabinose isomerase
VVEAHGQVEYGRVRAGSSQKEKRLTPQQQRAHSHGTPTITHSQPTARLTDHQNSHESAHGERKTAYLKNNANDVCVVLGWEKRDGVKRRVTEEGDDLGL